MTRFLILLTLVLGLPGCDEVYQQQMDACKRACAPLLIEHITYRECKCAPSPAPVTR